MTEPVSTGKPYRRLRPAGRGLAGDAWRLPASFTLALQVPPAARSQRTRLPCPPSRPYWGHRDRLTTTASKSPRTRSKSSGCRHQRLPACRNSSTAQDRPFAGFRPFVFHPRGCSAWPDLRPGGTVNLGFGFAGLVTSKLACCPPPRDDNVHGATVTCGYLAETQPTAVDTSLCTADRPAPRLAGRDSNASCAAQSVGDLRLGGALDPRAGQPPGERAGAVADGGAAGPAWTSPRITPTAACGANRPVLRTTS